MGSFLLRESALGTFGRSLGRKRGSTWGKDREEGSGKGRGGLGERQGRGQGRRMISLACSCLWIFGGIISYLREPLPITKDPRHYPQGIDIQVSPAGDILRAHLCTRVYTVVYTWVYNCVHVGIQLCTRGYTIVYTRVYSSLLGRSYSLGISRLGHRYFYLRSIHLDDLALAL